MLMVWSVERSGKTEAWPEHSKSWDFRLHSSSTRISQAWLPLGAELPPGMITSPVAILLSHLAGLDSCAPHALSPLDLRSPHVFPINFLFEVELLLLFGIKEL